MLQVELNNIEDITSFLEHEKHRHRATLISGHRTIESGRVQLQFSSIDMKEDSIHIYINSSEKSMYRIPHTSSMPIRWRGPPASCTNKAVASEVGEEAYIAGSSPAEMPTRCSVAAVSKTKRQALAWS